jgi:hypothetical protein
VLECVDLGALLVLGRELVEDRFTLLCRVDEEDVGREEF